MQVANDHFHLAGKLESLRKLQHLGDQDGWNMDNVTKRLKGAGEGVFEMQLEVQREGLVVVLDEIRWDDVGGEAGFRAAERGVRQVVYNLESLGRVLKVSLFFPHQPPQ